MRLAFYAPMKPPDHPVPSGDRTIARSLIAALEAAGAGVTLASRLRTRDGAGDPALQQDLIRQADVKTDRILASDIARDWQGWITYHSYYKAPDLIGPRVAHALGIPYLQVETSRASKRLDGPWQAFAERAEAAADAARVIFYLSERDAETLRRDAPTDQALIHLRPFLLRNRIEDAVPAQDGPILSVGMMRNGDKLASYRLIAETLHLLGNVPWQLEIAGDGPARPEVEALMAPFGEAVRFLGALDPAALHDAYARARVFLWPGVNEALGLAYLEAQAAALPVVAQDRPGMREVLAPGTYPPVAEGPNGLARLLQTRLSAPGDAGRKALQHVRSHHLLPQAIQTVSRGLNTAGIRP